MKEKRVCVFVSLLVFRTQISEMKKQNHELLERVHHLQNEVTDSDMRRHELDNQLRNANLVRVASLRESNREREDSFL